MMYEKSCGAVIYRVVDGKRQYLLLLNKKGDVRGHWGFAKGHTENRENEYETAAREILEETGLYVVFCGKERIVSHYSPKPDTQKDAVYFLATVRDNQVVKLQKEEVAEYRWCEFAEARLLLTFDGEILQKFENTF